MSAQPTQQRVKVWKVASERGLRKVSLDYALQEELGIGLAAAKGIVDRLLEGEVFYFDVDEGSVDRLVQRVQECGAHAEVDPGSEFERFEDLTRKLLEVSKRELDEKRNGEAPA